MNNEAELANMLQKSFKGEWNIIDDPYIEVARDAGTENLSLHMDLMGPDESWNLFKSVAFANEALPSEFETIGKKIVEKCHGLPLTIAVVAGLGFGQAKRCKRGIFGTNLCAIACGFGGGPGFQACYGLKID
ncbi:hypothetical protein BC332_17917 [Capsicum chinense]|nr:hypothetical protein BC332_17917 [Capsicum chinense]